ncbi:MAG: hypothetical protein HYY16_03135 [Planctomycetes bacterium]|nr:hypothetical protein [Planctomycetota bacterium]
MTRLLLVLCVLQSAPDAVQLEQGMVHAASRISELESAHRLAQAEGAELFFYGGTARNLAFFVKEQLRLKGQAFFAETSPIYLEDVVGPYSDMDLILRGTPDAASRIEAKLAEQFPGGERFYKWDVRTEEYLKEPWQITQGYEPISKMLLGRRGFEEPAWRRQAFGESLTERGARELLSGRITYVRNPQYEESAPFQKHEHHEILEVFRALRFATEFTGVELTPESRASIQAIIGEARASGELKAFLSNSLFKTRFEVGLQKLQYTSRDTRRLFDMLEEVGLAELVRESGFALRTPLAKAPPEDGAAVERLGPVTVYHGAKGGYKAAWSIARGGPFMTEYGDKGVYSSSDLNRALGYAVGNADFVVRMELSPDARVGIDVVVDRDVYLLKTDRAIKRVERPLTSVELMGRIASLAIRPDTRVLQDIRLRVETADLDAIRRAWPLRERLAKIVQDVDRRPAADPNDQEFREKLRETLRAFDLAKERAVDAYKAKTIEAEIDLLPTHRGLSSLVRREAQRLEKALEDFPKSPQRRVELTQRLRGVVASLLSEDQLAEVQKTNPLLYLRLLPFEKRFRRALSESDSVEQTDFRKEVEGFAQDLRQAKANVINAEIGRFFELDANASTWSSEEAGAIADWIATELPGLENRDQLMDRLRAVIAPARRDLSPANVERNVKFLSHLLRYQGVLPDELREIRAEVVRYAVRVVEDRFEMEDLSWAKRFLVENGILHEVYARLAPAHRQKVLDNLDSRWDFLWKVVQTDPSADLRLWAWERIVQLLSREAATRSAQLTSVNSVIRHEPDPGVRDEVLYLLQPSAPQELRDTVESMRDMGRPAAKGFEDARETPAWRSGAVDSEFARAAVWKALDGVERGDPAAVGAMRGVLEGWVRAGKVPAGPDGYFSSLRALAYFAKQVPDKEFQSLYGQTQELIARRVLEVFETRPGSAMIVADAWSFLLEQMEGWGELREFGRIREVVTPYAVNSLERDWMSERSALTFLHRVGELEGVYARMRSIRRAELLSGARRLYEGGSEPGMADFLRKIAESDPDPKLRWWAWRELLETDPSELRRLFPALAYEGVPELRWILRAEAARIAEGVTDPGLLATLEGQEGFAEAWRERVEARARGGLTPLEGPLSKEMYDKVDGYTDDLRLTPAWGRAARTGKPFEGLPFDRAKVWKALEEGKDSSLIEMRGMLEEWVRQGKVPEGPDGYASSLNGLLEFASRAKARGGKAAREFGEVFERAQGVLAERAIEEIRGTDEKRFPVADAVEFLFKLRASDAVFRGYLSLSREKQAAVVKLMDDSSRPLEGFFELLRRVADSVPDPEARRQAWRMLILHDRAADALERILPYERNVWVQRHALETLLGVPSNARGNATLARFAAEAADPRMLDLLFTAAKRGTFDSSKVVGEALRRRSDFDAISRTTPRSGALLPDPAMMLEDPSLTPAWQRAHAGPQNRAVGRWVVREAMGAAQFGAAYLVKEAAKARSVRQLRESALAMKEPMFWGSLGVFSGTAQVTRAGLRWVPMPRWARGVSMAAFPLAAGMGAMQGMAGQFSPKDLAISTGVFLGVGTVVDVAARLVMRSSTGWWLGVAKLAATLYLAEVAEGRLRPAARGLRERIEGIVP